ncbi:YcaO-like family protein [Pseudonocardia sp.]|uniref:YcaO-like family protein n=1 Tax=Pseudonocardia sp. TaxID=60912 RepID=UPI00261E4FF7|nr:YcaO-like family protein [Pseudonocardia sp.]
MTGVMRMRGVFGYHEFFWSGHADRFDDSRSLAILEGLERYAGLRPRGPENQVIDSFANLGEVALDPRNCGVYSDDYYSDRSYHRRFDEQKPMRWVWGHSLRDERPVLLPEQIVYYGSGILGGHETFVMECSNGCATGSCPEEAVFFGLLELIERDAFLLCWYGRAGLPEIDPATCMSTDTRIMIDLVGHMGYDVRLFDNRIDLPIPVVTAVAVRRDGGLGTLCFAAGASLDPEDAVRAALCEVASYVPDFDRRTESDLAEARAMAGDFGKVHELRHHALLYGLPEMRHHADFLLGNQAPPLSMVQTYAGWEAQRPRNLDLLDDVAYLSGLLSGRGFDVIVVDQTSREQRAEGVSTHCVVVPGLLPIDFGWDRQRARHMSRTRTAFRDAPRWARELDVSELHCAPHPFP